MNARDHVPLWQFRPLSREELSGNSEPNRNRPREEMQEERSEDMTHTLIGLGSHVHSPP